MQESRLRWPGHLKRRGEEYVGMRVREIEAEGARKRGRPRRRWLHSIKEGLKAKRLTGEEVVNRAHWGPQKYRPHIKVGKDGRKEGRKEEEEISNYHCVFRTNLRTKICLNNKISVQAC